MRTWANAAVAGILAVAAGCKGEKPPDVPGATPGGPTTSATPGPADAGGAPPDAGGPPQEPTVPTRQHFQADGSRVVSVDARGATWLDGELMDPMRIRREIEAEARREGGPRRIVLLAPSAEAWSSVQGFATMAQEIGLEDVSLVFTDPSCAGLAPAVQAGGGAPPVPPAPPMPPPAPPVSPPHGAGG